MKRELHYFDIYPKTVQSGEEAIITIKCLERRFRGKDGQTAKIRVIPMTESLEGIGGEYDEVTAVWNGGDVTFSKRFGMEQEYGIIIYLNEHDYVRLSIYALDRDLYNLIPLKGDFHVHSSYSDGWESPEYVAAYYREAGYDFNVISDHGNYEGSVAAKEFYRDTAIDLNIVYGEEVHSPGNHVHIVNFGGSFSVNDLFRDDMTRYEIEVKEIKDGLSGLLVFSNDYEKFEYAACLWVYNKIREGGGLAIFAHPHWIVEAYNVRDTITKLQFENKCFDAFELVGGMSPKENNMQLAFYYTALKNGCCDIPIVGSSDSHGVIRKGFSGSSFGGFENPYGFDELQTIVFAEENTKDSIVSAVKKGCSVAVDRYRGETPRVYGDYRYVSYALFLLDEYFPLHDEICVEEGRLMKRLVQGDTGAKPELERLSGRVGKMIDKYFRKN